MVFDVQEGKNDLVGILDPLFHVLGFESLGNLRGAHHKDPVGRGIKDGIRKEMLKDVNLG